MLLFVTLVSLVCSLNPVKDFIDEHAEERKFRPPSEFGDTEFDYRLLRPNIRNNGRKKPLVVWLHGYGDYEFDLRNGQLKYVDELFPNEESVRHSSFYLLALQVPREVGTWTNQIGSSPGDDLLKVLICLVDELVENEQIDPERVYAVGISGGGTACWSLAVRYPNRFAAIAPLASSGLPRDELVALPPVKSNIWAFHAEADYPFSVAATVTAMKSRSAKAHLTLIPGAAHNCWTRAMKDYELRQWLLSQRIGASTVFNPPGRRPWKRWHFYFQLGLPIILSIAAAMEYRRLS